ncbi:MAG: hypothetical protein IKJ84_00780 [Oscillospiraceae bacterium]|nr:hypothetical protein [Oscillospiraceae bacterium]
MERELDLEKLMGILWRRLGVLVLAAVLGAGVALGVGRFLVTPQYRSTVVLYVIETRSERDLAESMEVIVKMRETLMEVIRQTELSCSHDQLRKRIAVESVRETDFFEVTVSAPDPYEADRVADVIGQILPQQVERIMEGTQVKVVGEAVPAQQPSVPHHPSNALLGAALGFLTALLAVTGKELFRPLEKGAVV